MSKRETRKNPGGTGTRAPSRGKAAAPRARKSTSGSKRSAAATTPGEEAQFEAVALEATGLEATGDEASAVEAAPVEAAPVEAAPVEAAPVEAAGAVGAGSTSGPLAAADRVAEGPAPTHEDEHFNPGGKPSSRRSLFPGAPRHVATEQRAPAVPAPPVAPVAQTPPAVPPAIRPRARTQAPSIDDALPPKRARMASLAAMQARPEVVAAREPAREAALDPPREPVAVTQAVAARRDEGEQAPLGARSTASRVLDGPAELAAAMVAARRRLELRSGNEEKLPPPRRKHHSLEPAEERLPRRLLRPAPAPAASAPTPIAPAAARAPDSTIQLTTSMLPESALVPESVGLAELDERAEGRAEPEQRDSTIEISPSILPEGAVLPDSERDLAAPISVELTASLASSLLVSSPPRASSVGSLREPPREGERSATLTMPSRSEPPADFDADEALDAKFDDAPMSDAEAPGAAPGAVPGAMPSAALSVAEMIELADSFDGGAEPFEAEADPLALPASRAIDPGPMLPAGDVGADPESLDAEPLDPESLDAEPLDPESLDAEPLDPESLDAGSSDAEPLDPESLDAGSSDAGPMAPGRRAPEPVPAYRPVDPSRGASQFDHDPDAPQPPPSGAAQDGAKVAGAAPSDAPQERLSLAGGLLDLVDGDRPSLADTGRLSLNVSALTATSPQHTPIATGSEYPIENESTLASSYPSELPGDGDLSISNFPPIDQDDAQQHLNAGSAGSSFPPASQADVDYSQLDLARSSAAPERSEPGARPEPQSRSTSAGSDSADQAAALRELMSSSVPVRSGRTAQMRLGPGATADDFDDFDAPASSSAKQAPEAPTEPRLDDDFGDDANASTSPPKPESSRSSAPSSEGWDDFASAVTDKPKTRGPMRPSERTGSAPTPPRPEPAGPKRPATQQPGTRSGAVARPAAPVAKSSKRPLVLGALATAIVATALVPFALLKRATSHAAACFAELERTTEGDARSCVPDATTLALPRRTPWLADETVRLDASTKLKAARLRYAQATAIHPDAAARRVAAGELVEVGYRGPLPIGHKVLPSLRGAFGELATLTETDTETRTLAFNAALALGDVDRAKVLAKDVQPADSFSVNLRRGALLCLEGDADRGVEALRAAEAMYLNVARNMESLGAARLALVACGRGGETLAVMRPMPRYVPALTALEANLGTEEGLKRASTRLDDAKLKIGGLSRLRIAPYVLNETKPTALEALRLLVPKFCSGAGLDPTLVRTPWVLFDIEAPVNVVFVNTAASEEAAEYVARLAAEVTTPLDCSGEECPAAEALKHPADVLREAARTLWFDAASEHARLGHRDEAVKAANRAVELTPSRRKYLAAPLLLAVGNAERALELLDDAVSREKDYHALALTRIFLNQALALVHLGRWETAQAAGEKAYLRALDATRDAENSHDTSFDTAVLDDDKLAAAWMWAATSLLNGKPEAVLATFNGNEDPQLAEIGNWVRIAFMKDDERRPLRWELALSTPSDVALPAVMYVASRAAPSTQNVEVWLDRIFHEEHMSQPARAMRARAEAARWRADGESEREWQGRARRLLGIVTDYRTSVLGHVLEVR